MAERTESAGDEETIWPEARCESEEFPRVDIAMDGGKKGAKAPGGSNEGN